MIAFTNEDKYTSDDIKYYSSPYGNVDTTGSYEQFLYYSYVYYYFHSTLNIFRHKPIYYKTCWNYDT